MSAQTKLLFIESNILLYVQILVCTGTMVSYRKYKRTIDSNIAVKLQEPNCVEHLFEQFLADSLSLSIIHFIVLISRFFFIHCVFIAVAAVTVAVAAAAAAAVRILNYIIS